MAYNVSYRHVKIVVDHSECSPPSCNIDAAKNEQYCVFLRLNFARVDLSRNYDVNYPVRRTGKHGETTLTLQRKLFVQDLTICMDVEANPGPDQLLNEIVSCSAQNQVTGIKLLTMNSNGMMTYSSSELRALRSSFAVSRYVFLTLKDYGILKTHRTRAGKRVGAKKYRIPTLCNFHYYPLGSASPTQVNYSRPSGDRPNLIRIQTTTAESSKPQSFLDFCLLNALSIRKKALLIKDFVVEHNLDLLAITETWLDPGDKDIYYVREICPTGYDFHHIPRADSNGGGVGLLVKKSLQIRKHNQTKVKSFEYMDVLVKYLNACIRLVIVYRPPPSEQNGLKENDFFDEFNSLLECWAITSSKLLITSDFNFHVNKPSETYAKKFLRMLNGFNLEQHVSEATHKNGNTLDLLITRSGDNFISDVRTMPGLINPKLFDHYAIRSQVKIKKPSFEQKEIIYRKLRAVDIEALQTDIKSSTLLSDYSNMDLTCLVENFEITLTNALDAHAPIKKRTITFRPYAPWYNDSIDVEKRKRRKLERRWRKSNLSTDKLYITQCGIVNNMISDAKSIYYSSIIAENKGNQKVLFKTIDQLLQRKQEPRFPTSTSSEQLVNEFAAFFHEKISKMRCNLSRDSESIINPLPDLLCQSEFTDFCTVNTNDIRKYLVSSGVKTCDLDPLPSILLRECLDTLLPVITRIVNLSLTTGNVPRHFKDAMVRPKLKKDSLDHQLFSHFRPISNLKLLSKVTEKAVACQLTDYLNANGLQERLQAAYKVAHSTETALLKVQSDIFNAIDKKESVLLLLLDLSAAFDTVQKMI